MTAPGPENAAADTSGAWRILRSRDFGPYFVGNAASATGTWFYTLAAGVLVFDLTGSAALLGVLSACQFGPVLLLAPWAGRIADGVDRRRLLFVTQSYAAGLSLVLAVLVWAGTAGAWLVIGLTAGLGVATALSNPAQMALVGSLVSRPDLPQAVALNAMTFNLARAVGPVAATVTIATVGYGAAFLVNACSYLLLVGGLLLVTPAPVEPAPRVTLRESFSFVRAQPRLLALLAIVMAVSVAADPVNALSPAFIEGFGHPVEWAGVIVGACGLGAVLAALFASGSATISRVRMGAMLALLGGGMVLAAASPWLPLALVFLVIAGFGFLGANAGATAQLQLSVDDSQRGRLMALWGIAWMGTRPLTSLVDGFLASGFGIRVATVVMALPVLGGAAYVLRTARASAEDGTTP